MNADNIGTPGPFQIIEGAGLGEVDAPIDPPRRRYECSHYDTCLELAAALNWDNFTCRGCNSEISKPLLWRAHQAKRKDSIADSLCGHLPQIDVHGCSSSAASKIAVSNNSETCAIDPAIHEIETVKALKTTHFVLSTTKSTTVSSENTEKIKADFKA